MKLEGKELLFLSSMLGKTDARYCVERGSGADMVQLGALLAAEEDRLEEEREIRPGSFLPQSELEMTKILSKEVEIVRQGLGQNVLVALNLGVFDLGAGLKAARAWEAAGGDYLELNVHGQWRGLSEGGYLRAMALEGHRKRLLNWSKSLVEEGPPLIVKFHRDTNVDFTSLLGEIHRAETGISALHFNIRGPNQKPDLPFAERIVKAARVPVLFSGYVRTAEAARSLFELGAAGVGFAQPVMEEKDFISRIAEASNK